MNKTVLLSDYELIASFQQGNTRAFDTLIDRYQEKIYNTILFMVKDSYSAEYHFAYNQTLSESSSDGQQ